MTATAPLTLTPVVLPDDRDALVETLTTSTFPFHVRPRPSAADVDARVADGSFEDDDHASLWVDHGALGRIGLVTLEDLSDDAPLVDLRLVERARGLGLGAHVLRAVTAHVFTTMPEVTRFEGQTREDNVAMRRTFLRCGFVKEAHYREGWPVDGGVPLASVAYAILRRDWETGTTTELVWDDLTA